MDTWTIAQYKMMKCGGNDRATRFFEYGVAGSRPPRKVCCRRRRRVSRQAQVRRGGPRVEKTKVDEILIRRQRRLLAIVQDVRGFGFGLGSGSGSGSFTAAVSSTAKSKAPKLKKGQFDLATGRDRCFGRIAPRNTRTVGARQAGGAKEGQFLMGLTPEKWVSFLKSLDRQDDRTYHLKKMSADERAQVVACMSGAPIPAPSSKTAFGGAKETPSEASATSTPSATIRRPRRRMRPSRRNRRNRQQPNDDDDDDDDNARPRASSRRRLGRILVGRGWRRRFGFGFGIGRSESASAAAWSLVADGCGVASGKRRSAARERRSDANGDVGKKRRRRALAMAQAQARAQAQAQAQARADALATSSNGVGSGRSSGSVRRPPEVGGFGGGLGAVPPGMEAVMPGPPPPPRGSFRGE